MKETDQDSLKLFTVLSRAMQTVKSHVETDIRKHGLTLQNLQSLNCFIQKVIKLCKKNWSKSAYR